LKTKTSSTKPILEKDLFISSEKLQDLGWVNIDLEQKELDRRKEYLKLNNGIKGLEVFHHNDIDDIVRVFYRDGFVVVRDALAQSQLEFLRTGVDREIREILFLDKQRVGNRGSHRYSFGGASMTGHQMHNPEWAMLIDLPTVTPILKSLFGSSNYIARGGGGDFCLPGAVDYQPLHSDMGDRRKIGQDTFGSFNDPRGRLNYRDLPCPYICCNFLTVDFNQVNGPTRQIPGSQHSQEKIPNLREEPEWMKLSTVCPAPAGSVLIRDVRAWHGGTPNLCDQVRAIPNAEFYAPWFREPIARSMPNDVYQNLSEHGKKLCQYIAVPPGVTLTTGYKEDLGSTPRVHNQPKAAKTQKEL
jgi:hypothetical protein